MRVNLDSCCINIHRPTTEVIINHHLLTLLLCATAKYYYSYSLSTLSQKSATAAEFGDSRRFLDSLTFVRECGQGFRRHVANTEKLEP